MDAEMKVRYQLNFQGFFDINLKLSPFSSYEESWQTSVRNAFFQSDRKNTELNENREHH